MPHILLLILVFTLQQAEMRTIRWMCSIKVTDQIKQDEMKDKSQTEYFRQVKRVLRPKLNRVTMIIAINIWAVSLVQYTAGIVKWRKDELEAMEG